MGNIIPLWFESMAGFISKGEAEECIVYIWMIMVGTID